ncbi:hypothetical protein TH63_09350 [Rufibacter radiotolerans]|uniref:DUF3987 domain-containing protein n=1 Tax=Rufibacter radiotolerans TaxID=1379910 RepID=A0A0H4VNV4_9BACT|nr:hypothetical protein TH63_09350 [Rufibacter radiotolerans]
MREYLSATSSQETLEFPLLAFPAPIRRIIEATRDSLLYPVDFMGSAILVAISVAVGNALKVQVKRAWQEGCTLFMALVGRPGTAKSHPLSFALAPFFKRDRALYQEYREEMEEYKAALALHKKIKDGSPPPEKPVIRKSLVQDSTPEALLEIHQRNPRGLGLYMDELMGFLNNFNRYSQGSEQETWLTVWSGKPLIQDRKSGEPLNIMDPSVSVVGTIQNGLLGQLAQGNRSVNGFMDRILFAFPPNLVKEYWSQTEIDPMVAVDWERYIGNLFDISLEVREDGSLEPRVVQFSPGARALLSEWQVHNTDLINNAPTESLGGLYVKLETYCIRLSLVLQAAMWATGEWDRDAVSEEAVQGSIMLTEYYRRTGTMVNDTINSYSPLENLREDRRAFYESLPVEFSTKEAKAIASGQGIAHRTLHEILKDKTLFMHLRHGKYQKLI